MGDTDRIPGFLVQPSSAPTVADTRGKESQDGSLLSHSISPPLYHSAFQINLNTVKLKHKQVREGHFLSILASEKTASANVLNSHKNISGPARWRK